MTGLLKLRLAQRGIIGKIGPSLWGLPSTTVGDFSTFRSRNVDFVLIKIQLSHGFAGTHENQTVPPEFAKRLVQTFGEGKGFKHRTFGTSDYFAYFLHVLDVQVDNVTKRLDSTGIDSFWIQALINSALSFQSPSVSICSSPKHIADIFFFTAHLGSPVSGR